MQKRFVRKMVFVGGQYRGWGVMDTRCWNTPHWVRDVYGNIIAVEDEDNAAMVADNLNYDFRLDLNRDLMPIM